MIFRGLIALSVSKSRLFRFCDTMRAPMKKSVRPIDELEKAPRAPTTYPMLKIETYEAATKVGTLMS
jgi:hypothetical protein